MTAPRTVRTLRVRIAGQRAMREVVEAQAGARPRTALERLLGIRALTPSARRAYDTALGDAVVGPMLEQLGPRWDVLHDVPVSPRDTDGVSRTIDHLVIGPAGVFAIRAVHCAGEDVVVDGAALVIGGVARDDLAELAASAAFAGHVLAPAAADGSEDLEVIPLLVAVEAARIVVRVEPEAVGVIGLSQVRRTLGQRRPRLGGEAAASISDLADRAETWPAAPDDDGDGLRAEFEVIRTQVSVALRRRTTWALAIFGTGALMMFTAIAAYVTFVVLG